MHLLVCELRLYIFICKNCINIQYPEDESSTLPRQYGTYMYHIIWGAWCFHLRDYCVLMQFLNNHEAGGSMDRRNVRTYAHVPRVPKMCSASPSLPTTSSQGIRGYISVMATVRFTYFCNWRNPFFLLKIIANFFNWQYVYFV